jgi:hypothetical protein
MTIKKTIGCFYNDKSTSLELLEVFCEAGGVESGVVCVFKSRTLDVGSPLSTWSICSHLTRNPNSPATVNMGALAFSPPLPAGP